MNNLGLEDDTQSPEALNRQLSLELVLAKAEKLGYVITDNTRTITESNELFLEIFKLPTETPIIGTKIDTIIDSLSLRDIGNDKIYTSEKLIELISRNFQSSAGMVFPLIATTKNGARVHVNNSYTHDGRMVVTVRNITKQQREKDLLEVALKSAGSGFWHLDFSTGKYTYSASVLERLSETEVEKMQAHGLWTIVHRKDLDNITKVWEGILTGEKEFDFTYRVVTEKDGTMWQRSVGQIERGADNKPVGAIAFVTDITKDVQKQKDLLSAQEASKAKSEFLARMSHEIRTPLNAIIGMSDSLKDEPLSQEVMEVIEDIEQAADGLHQLLSKTLDHAKLISNNMQIDLHPANISDLIETCHRLWRPQCSAKNIKLGKHIDQDIADEYLLDSFRLQQCLNNLLSNAVKFTNEGQINIRVKKTAHKGRDSLVIAVSDTGVGMSSEQEGAIFDAFVQADNSISRKYGGTGLGMSITKQLTELMGGEIRVKSNAGKGTVFAIIIPILETENDLKNITGQDVTDKTAPEPIKLDAKPQHVLPEIAVENKIEPRSSIENNELTMDKSKPFSGLSVLCVEDNPVNQKVVERLIGKRVSRLTCANNGREALDILSTMHVDVVLMDIHMPVMDGIEATLQIRSSEATWANVIIIALTADPEYQTQRICRNIGMNDTIAKPVKRAEILDAFDRTLGSLSESFGVKIKLTG